jgi:hypothetical protein
MSYSWDGEIVVSHYHSNLWATATCANGVVTYHYIE